MGNNKDALKQLRTLSENEQKTLRYQYLFAAINYKLSEYSKAANTYVSVLEESKEELENEDVSDIVVNYLACQGSLKQSSLESIKFIQNKDEFP